MSGAESAAIAWANAHASEEQDPVIFGAKVAAVVDVSLAKEAA